MDLNWKTALQAANALVFQHLGKYLSDVEIMILHGAWNNYTYEQIAEAKGYTSSYLCRDIGRRLWENLSIALRVKVSKTNFKAALKREWQNYTQAIQSRNRNQLSKFITTENIALFEGLVALDATIYLDRLPIETICRETITQPRSLIRIKGAKWMGKISLVDRILEQGNLQKQATVYLDFSSVDRRILQDPDKLLRWLSTMVYGQLNLENKVVYYWDKNSSDSNNNCTVYFKEYILPSTKRDVILALDNIDRLFSGKDTGEKFLRLLYSWHEKGKTNPYWSKLKLITTQSTKADIPADTDNFYIKSGTSILLEEFNYHQVKTMTKFYQLDWGYWEISRLMNEVGGNPYLIRLAMHQEKTKNIAMAQ